jgi:putative RecB family exonuclease
MVAMMQAPRPPPRVEPRPYLSFSAIRTYQTCPLRYYFRYVARLPEESVSPSLVFGAGIHRAIEHHFRELLAGQALPGIESLLAAYGAEWSQRGRVRFRKGQQRAWFDGLARRMLGAFQASAFARPQGRILAIEEELRGPVASGVPDLLGIVDLIVDAPQALVLRDWKTSRSKWSAVEIEQAAEQLLLYAELAADFAPGKPVRLEFAVLTKTKEVRVDRHAIEPTKGMTDRLKRVVQRVWRAIEAEHFYPAPAPLACGGCPFREPCRRWPGR